MFWKFFESIEERRNGNDSNNTGSSWGATHNNKRLRRILQQVRNTYHMASSPAHILLTIFLSLGPQIYLVMKICLSIAIAVCNFFKCSTGQWRSRRYLTP